MTQGTLFTAAEVCPLCGRDDGSHVAGCVREVPIARRTDPASSRAAAEAITRSGERQRQTVFARLGQDGCKAIGCEILELVGVEMKVAALRLGNIGARFGALRQCHPCQSFCFRKSSPPARFLNLVPLSCEATASIPKREADGSNCSLTTWQPAEPTSPSESERDFRRW